MKILPVMLICAGAFLFASCDSRRTDTDAERTETEETPLDQTNTPVPPPPEGTNTGSDRGPGTGPGTGVVQTGEYDGGEMLVNDSVMEGGAKTGVPGPRRSTETEAKTGAGSKR